MTKHRALSKPARQLVELVSSGVKPALAAKIVGRSERQARRTLARPDVQQLLHDLAVSRLAHAKGMAADKLITLAEQTDSKKVSLDAAKHILACGNIRPPDGPAAQVNIAIGPFPSRSVLTPHMSDQEVEAIKAECAAYGGPGYLIDLRGAPKQIEHVASEPNDA